MKKIYDLNLVERNDVAENTIELIFTKPSDYEFKIGQYTFLNVGEDPQDKNFARALSIASHPDEDLLRFVMRTSDSEFKQRCLAMKKGDSATVTKATGSFGFKFSDKEIVFLISGIGIAPIIPMLMELENEERFIICLSVFEGYKGDEIAGILGLKPATVRSKKQRALAKLKEVIKE